MMTTPSATATPSSAAAVAGIGGGPPPGSQEYTPPTSSSTQHQPLQEFVKKNLYYGAKYPFKTRYIVPGKEKIIKRYLKSR